MVGFSSVLRGCLNARWRTRNSPRRNSKGTRVGEGLRTCAHNSNGACLVFFRRNYAWKLPSKPRKPVIMNRWNCQSTIVALSAQKRWALGAALGRRSGVLGWGAAGGGAAAATGGARMASSRACCTSSTPRSAGRQCSCPRRRSCPRLIDR